MSATQLSFSIRVSAGIKTVHLLGSWDNYTGQLPLSKDKTSSKAGAWKGKFRFQGSTLEAGQRYWYYYIVDGYHVAYNPSVEFTVEPTTGRELNILDVPARSETSSSSSSSSSSRKSSSTSSSSHKSSSKSSSKHSSSSSSSKDKDSHRSSRSTRESLRVEIPKGRPLSISQIKAPKPMSPRGDKHILNASYDSEEIAELTARLGSAALDEEDIITNFSTSPVSSTASSLSDRSDSSSPSSSGYSSPNSDYSSCTCERYGITRKGERVKIDCGGSRCGYEDSSDCSSYLSESEEEESYAPVNTSRRHGMIVA